MTWKHGVYTNETPTSILPSRNVDSNVVFVVGCAAVHTLAEGKPRYVHQPRKYFSYDEFVAEMGWDAEHFSDYSLQEAIYSHFALYRGAPVVAVNVFDPARHKTRVDFEALTLDGDTARLAHGSLMNVAVTSASVTSQTETVSAETLTLDGDTGQLAHVRVSDVVVGSSTGNDVYQEGTDYTVDAVSGSITRIASGSIAANAELVVSYDYTVSATPAFIAGVDYDLNTLTGELTRLPDGAIPANAELLVSYDHADVAMVTSEDIIGGIDAEGNSLGFELVDSVFPLFRVVPGSLLCPRYGEDPMVAVVMTAKSYNINGLFNAIAVTDVPTSGPSAVTKYTEVAAYKQNNNLSDPHLVLCWPKVRLGNMLFGLSTHLVGLMSQTDYSNDGVPYESCSNKRLNITSIGYATDAGEWQELALGMEKVNSLNGEGIFSALNWDGGLRSWGGRMSCYPTNTDPKDCQEPIRRMFNWMQNTFILTWFQKVDAPLTPRLIQTILKSEQIRLDGFTAREILLGGSISFDAGENPLTDLVDGIVRFHHRITPPPAARDIESTFEFDVENLNMLFS